MAEFCKKCGACCKQREQPCKYFNGRTCDEYYSRWDVCAEFPYYEINGVKKTICEWARIYNRPQGTVRCRVKRLGWDIQKALTTPPLKRNGEPL